MNFAGKNFLFTDSSARAGYSEIELINIGVDL
jgi:hypothetical protein